ncbi:hypothetical protein KTAU_02310 [Thermogemmatispora aurantia]|uniref:Uncharacterized protein n=1 Tax=Thermogemmatispora aurantia TaxID=2045279 RepID=A0A5J4K194_9CHLR|nr:hypothetical protein KTAU_02310 [Thermogemmatispora aurantia]
MQVRSLRNALQAIKNEEPPCREALVRLPALDRVASLLPLLSSRRARRKARGKRYEAKAKARKAYQPAKGKAKANKQHKPYKEERGGNRNS